VGGRREELNLGERSKRARAARTISNRLAASASELLAPSLDNLPVVERGGADFAVCEQA
jgi:hypothetical protein